MKIIGITGGVGAGKSSLLRFIKEKYNAHVIFADEVAHRVMEPGTKAYQELIEVFGYEIVAEGGSIDKKQMAKRIFDNPLLRVKVNGIIHPAVKETILEEIETIKNQKERPYIFIEAALLIEDHYDLICDEIWYIYADAKVRKKRLMESRNYTEEKIQKILESQLKDKEFRDKCTVIIDNSGDLINAFEQIENTLGGNDLCTK